jgi:hypothetical protein
MHSSAWDGDKADSTIISAALGVDQEGRKEVFALQACAEEDKDGWACLLQDLRTRGATHIDLIVTDGHDGLLAAVGWVRRRWFFAPYPACHSPRKGRISLIQTPITDIL